MDKTCKHGHPLTPVNRIKNGQGRNRCKLCNDLKSVKYVLSVKKEVLTHYGKNGGLQCCWTGCDVTDIDMLSLDHMEDDGAEHRKRMGNQGGIRMYVRLRQEGYPLGFQTLCMNHQTKKEMLRRRNG